jgi:N6-adenosine-specific RNA methylase IME4
MFQQDDIFANQVNQAVAGCGAESMSSASSLLAFVDGRQFSTILVDPPWQFTNRTGKVAPEHRRLSRYQTMTLAEIGSLPVAEIAAPTAHLYLWVPNALLST